MGSTRGDSRSRVARSKGTAIQDASWPPFGEVLRRYSQAVKIEVPFHLPLALKEINTGPLVQGAPVLWCGEGLGRPFSAARSYLKLGHLISSREAKRFPRRFGRGVQACRQTEHYHDGHNGLDDGYGLREDSGNFGQPHRYHAQDELRPSPVLLVE